MGGGFHSAGGGRRPVKVWNSGRTIRKALVVSTYEEFQRKGREKLGLSSEEPISIVLEGDGTQVQIVHQYIYGRAIFVSCFCKIFSVKKIVMNFTCMDIY